MDYRIDGFFPSHRARRLLIFPAKNVHSAVPFDAVLFHKVVVVFFFYSRELGIDAFSWYTVYIPLVILIVCMKLTMIIYHLCMGQWT